jgi:LPPG:FO 2-phospho-L-lactate transferase
VNVVVLAGGIGAGKFLRGMVRALPPENVTVLVNTGDDIELHGLHISPDIDSVTYWLAAVADRDRGWGLAGDTFRASEELRAFGAPGSWFNLGDVDLAMHLFRTHLLSSGSTLTEATARICERFGVSARLVPMTDDRVETRVIVVGENGEELDLHFQEYWVLRGARDDVKDVVYRGNRTARSTAPALVEGADAIVICPSNPVASIGPILAIPGVRTSLAGRRDRVVGVSPIVGGAPLRGMADKLMPVAGLEVSAVGAARAYEGLLGAWVVDERDRRLAEHVEVTGIRVGVTDTIMEDDAKAEALARFALGLVS